MLSGRDAPLLSHRSGTAQYNAPVPDGFNNGGRIVWQSRCIPLSSVHDRLSGLVLCNLLSQEGTATYRLTWWAKCGRGYHLATTSRVWARRCRCQPTQVPSRWRQRPGVLLGPGSEPRSANARGGNGQARRSVRRSIPTRLRVHARRSGNPHTLPWVCGLALYAHRPRTSSALNRGVCLDYYYGYYTKPPSYFGR